MGSTFERLRDILQRDYQVDAAAVTPEATLESLQIDSLGATELLFTIEDAFGVKVTKEPPDLATVGDVVGYIDALVAYRSDDDVEPASPAADR